MVDRTSARPNAVARGESARGMDPSYIPRMSRIKFLIGLAEGLLGPGLPKDIYSRALKSLGIRDYARHCETDVGQTPGKSRIKNFDRTHQRSITDVPWAGAAG